VVILFSKSWIYSEWEGPCPEDMAPAEDIAEEPSSRKWIAGAIRSREALAEEARAEEGESHFSVNGSLRVGWHQDQRADPQLSAMIKNPPDGYRVADEGLLEKGIISKGRPDTLWVPVVPRGEAGKGVIWKRFCFLAAHAGLWGGHRSEVVTWKI
jgi:hypothetical protein